jgi:hypothetical protein
VLLLLLLPPLLLQLLPLRLRRRGGPRRRPAAPTWPLNFEQAAATLVPLERERRRREGLVYGTEEVTGEVNGHLIFCSGRANHRHS